jgi:hypothetical protein
MKSDQVSRHRGQPNTQEGGEKKKEKEREREKEVVQDGHTLFPKLVVALSCCKNVYFFFQSPWF